MPSDLEHLEKQENLCSEVEELVQWLRTRTTPAEDLSFVPFTHISQLTSASDYCYRDSNIVFWPPRVLKLTTTHSHVGTCTKLKLK